MGLIVSIQKKFSASFSLHVDFSCKGERLALLGASGSGKTQTLRCIAGVTRPDSGKIILNDRVLFDSEKRINLPPQKRRVGYLFQHGALFPHMTAAENIAQGCPSLPAVQRKQAVSELLTRIKLNTEKNLYPSQLSGGQRQRVALARILAGEPDLLLLDEPFTALDENLKWQMENELLETLDSFTGPIIFVSHNRGEAYRLCERICVIAKGKSAQTSDIKTLFTNPQTLSACLLSGCKNISAVSRTAEGGIYAQDWGILLSGTFSADTCFVGVRAHAIRPVQHDAGLQNTMECTIVRVTEDVFSFILQLQTAVGGILRMELTKAEWAALGKPSKLNVQLSEIMALQSDA